MKIAIMGTGAMACLFGGRLMNQGHEVWLISGWKQHLEKIQKDGLTVQREADSFQVKPHATQRAADVTEAGGYPDLVLISCKGMETRSTVKKALPIIGPETYVLTLQNGIGNADVIAESVAHDRIVYGSASVAADLIELGHVKDTTNRNRSPLVSMMPFNRVMNARCEEIGQLFTDIGYDTNASLSAEKNIWTKLCVNCCANATGAVTRLPNYIYSNDRYGFQLINKLCAEVVTVAQAKGIDLDYEDMRAYIHLTLHNQHHFISMLQDVHNKRPIEVDTINGAVVREAKKLGIPTPVNETMALVLKVIAGNYDNMLM